MCPLRGWWEQENGANGKEQGKDGGGGKSVVAEEASLGLDVRVKVYIQPTTMGHLVLF